MGLMHDGDEIIVPANTYIATIIAITRNHLVPVLVEPTWEHLEIDIDKIETAITPKTKGVMIVHLYGRIAYNDQLGDICKMHNRCRTKNRMKKNGGAMTAPPLFSKCFQNAFESVFDFFQRLFRSFFRRIFRNFFRSLFRSLLFFQSSETAGSFSRKVLSPPPGSETCVR